MARYNIFNEAAPWMARATLDAIGVEVERAHDLGGTFSCESASDLREIASGLMAYGISNRNAALLRYYAERIECENGAATTLDHAIAKALLALHDGAMPEATLATITAAIAAYVPEDGT